MAFAIAGVAPWIASVIKHLITNATNVLRDFIARGNQLADERRAAHVRFASASAKFQTFPGIPEVRSHLFEAIACVSAEFKSPSIRERCDIAIKECRRGGTEAAIRALDELKAELSKR